jgi:WD40 repeat protein
VLHGGGARVLDDALSADGRLFAVQADDGSVAFFDGRTLRETGPRVETNGQISYFGAIVRPVRSLAFSPDGRTLAVGDSDGRVARLFLVDTRTHSVRAALTSPATAVTADVAFAPDGRTLVTGEAVSGRTSPPDEVLVSRRIADGTAVRRSQSIAGARLIGFTRDGRSLLVTSGETRSFLLDSKTFKRLRTFHVSGTAALSPAGNTAAFGRDDGSVILVNLRTGAERPIARRATGRVIAVGFSADGKTLATASDDGTVGLWDVPMATPRETFEGHNAAALGTLFSPDGATLYSGSSDGSVIVWDVRGERRLGRPFRFDPTAAGGEGAHTPTENASTAVAVSPDNSIFATSPASGRVTLWRSSDQAVLGELRGPSGGVVSLAFSHDGSLIAATGDAGNTVVWDAATRKIDRVIAPAGSEGNPGVAFSPDDHLVATAGGKGSLRVYDLHTGRRIGSAQAPGTLQDLDFSPDGKLLAAAGLSGDILLWNVMKHALERTIHHKAAILTIRFSPDGKTIATGDLPGNVDFWNPATGSQVGRTLGGQNGLVLSVSFNPRGTQLVTTSSDGKFRLWDIASGKLIGAPLPGADTGGWGLFFPDGKHVIAVFNSGTGVVWNVDPAAWKVEACRVAHRNLTPSEWRDFLPERGYGDTCP